MLPERVDNEPFVVAGTMGAEAFELTVIGTAGIIRLLFGPVGGGFGADAPASLGAVTDVLALGTGARASARVGFDSLGGVGPGAGDTVDIGVMLLPAGACCALSSTGSSLGA